MIGGGPAGSLCAYFLQRAARQAGFGLHVDIYEPRDFSRPGPAGCNMCGGILSETLIQALAGEEINLPPSLGQRPIVSYVLTTDSGSVRIGMPRPDRQIAALYRGAGPLLGAGGRGDGLPEPQGRGVGLDAYLLGRATALGAIHLPRRVTGLSREDGRPVVHVGAQAQVYDLLVGATGVNTTAWPLFRRLGLRSGPPQTMRAYITELPVSAADAAPCLGEAMHIFLLGIARLEFAAIIPKQDMLTVCLLGDHIDQAMVDAFFATAAVRRILPPGVAWRAPLCRCTPLINVAPAHLPLADRVVLVGDCGVTRLYKDGIGAAYHTAKAAAEAAVRHGVSAAVFRRHYLPVYRGIARDNQYGRVLFFGARRFQVFPPLLRAVLALAAREQALPGPRRLSLVLWDLFTGSARYREILIRACDPRLLARLAWESVRGIGRPDRARSSGPPRPGPEMKRETRWTH